MRSFATRSLVWIWFNSALLANSLPPDTKVWKRSQVTSVAFPEDAGPVSMWCFHSALVEPLPSRAPVPCAALQCQQSIKSRSLFPQEQCNCGIPPPWGHSNPRCDPPTSLGCTENLGKEFFHEFPLSQDLPFTAINE